MSVTAPHILIAGRRHRRPCFYGFGDCRKIVSVQGKSIVAGGRRRRDAIFACSRPAGFCRSFFAGAGRLVTLVCRRYSRHYFVAPDTPSGGAVYGRICRVPGALAAKCLGVPLLLHEQNAVPGRANRLLKKIAKRVLCGFPDGFGEWVGNPVRQGFLNVRRRRRVMALVAARCEF